MPSMQDLRSDAQRQLAYLCLTDGGSVAGGTNTKWKHANTLTYLYDGQFKAKTTTDNVIVVAPTVAQLPYDFQKWTLYNMTTAGPTAAVTFYVVVAFDSAGEFVFFQGDYAGQDLTFRGMPLVKGVGGIPQIPPGFVVVAIMKLVFSAASVFTWGTTALADAGNLTITFGDYAVLPSTTTATFT